MNKLVRELSTRKKAVLIFLLAILLPALVVGYMSFEAFSQRREAVRRLLESSLWTSSESVLRTVESALVEMETSALRPEHLTGLSATGHADRGEDRSNVPGVPASRDIPGRPFLLDGEFRVVFPRTESESPSLLSERIVETKGEFAEALQRAERLEFSQKNFPAAARAYREAAARAPSDRDKARALEAAGRSLLAAGNLREAYRVYDDLAAQFSRIEDRAGHFFGLKAAFQMYEIEKRLREEGAGLRILLDTYRDLKNGNWPVGLAEYEFFVSEIRTLMESGLGGGGPQEISEAYQALENQPSPYLETLLLSEFVKQDIVPRIRERIGVSSFRGGPELLTDRMLVDRNGGYELVSYSPIPDLDGRGLHYGGFLWDLDDLEKRILPDIFARTSSETGLVIRSLAEIRLESSALSGEPEDKSTLSLPYREFPLPWRLRVTQPALEELGRTARRENFLYGALLGLIVVLMFLGAALLARDISREAETTRLKTEFVHNISHELKTPLTLIRLYGETLQRKQNLPEEKRRESYEIITKESERLSHLINNVLDFSRIDMGRREFNFAKGSLPRVVRETLDSYRYHLEKKGFTVHEDIALDLPDMVFDGDALASAIVNLLSNAMKFSPDRKAITVRLFRKDGLAVIEVEDRGMGISAQDVGLVFERFFRVRNAVVSETRGSGLGLTLVKHTAESHGGTVQVESEPGKGSVFSIVLPISGRGKGEGK